jgi:predicted DsbA family dithiol-disulfide isomerase
MNLPATIKIDFVSDISCPWCAIGLAALETALQRIDPAPHVQLHFQPFELNPAMPKGGQDITEHLTEKYGSTPVQQAQIRETIRQRGAALGFEFRPAGRDRIYNTFDAHRLLHWAGLPENGSGERQHALKKNLLAAYFTHGQSPESHEVLINAAKSAGLDGERAQAILSSDEFTDEVRERQRFYTSAGIHSVPAVILNDQFLISGGQPVEVFEDALRQILAAPVA